MPVLSLTLTLIRAVVMVTVPAASVTQNAAGVAQVLLTDIEVVVGMEAALVYATRMMSAAQTCTFILPLPTVKVTPVVSTVNVVPVGAAPVHVTVEPPAPVWPPAPRPPEPSWPLTPPEPVPPAPPMRPPTPAPPEAPLLPVAPAVPPPVALPPA